MAASYTIIKSYKILENDVIKFKEIVDKYGMLWNKSPLTFQGRYDCVIRGLQEEFGKFEEDADFLALDKI